MAGGGRRHWESPGIADGAASPATLHPPPATRYYQLTHDYLVHSLRDWLTRKQRETRRGRAELRLAERSSLWNAKPENRHLPSRAGVGEHPAADEQARLDRAAAQDDETGGAGAWSQDARISHAGLVDHLGSDRGLWHTTGFGSGGLPPESRHTRRSGHRQATR